MNPKQYKQTYRQAHIIKLLKTNDKERILRTNREKEKYNRRAKRLTNNFSSEMMEAIR